MHSSYLGSCTTKTDDADRVLAVRYRLGREVPEDSDIVDWDSAKLQVIPLSV